MENPDNQILGYSAFSLFEDCYEYNENACYIADSSESLIKFIKEAMRDINDYKIVPINLNDIRDDYGCSCGEYAMEPEVLKRFEQLSALTYNVKPYENLFAEEEPDLFIVNIKNNASEALGKLSTDIENDQYTSHIETPNKSGQTH